MKNVRINLAGKAQRAKFSLELESDLQSAHDWLVAVSAFNRGDRIATADLDWHYSARADANFAYLEKASGQAVVTFSAINSSCPFDAIEIQILPWSTAAKQMADSPEIKNCTFEITNHVIQGSEAVTSMGTIGIVREGE